MSWMTWIVVGMLAGVLAKIAMPGRRDEPSGLVKTLLLGIVGAVIGGWIWNMFSAPGADGLNIGSLFVAFVGSCIVIGIIRMFDRPTRT